MLVAVFITFLQGAFGNDSKLLQLPYYPKFKEVIVKFYSTYSTVGIEYPKQIGMAKKPDGWHAIIINKSNDSILFDDLFWSREKGKYLEVNLTKATSEQVKDPDPSLLNDWLLIYNSNISPFYGYIGWEKDVIDEYGSKTNLSDTLTNALARAYSSFAANLINNNSGLSSAKQRFKLPPGQNALTAEQLARYREYEHLSIDTYYRLYQLNPAFESSVADAFNQYSDEVVNSYMTLLYHQNYAEARKELKKGLYDRFILDMARRYLASCDSNAILIENGDMDTFPLLYVQETEGYRTDVTVMNINLLSNGRYISHLFLDYPGKKPIKFHLPEEIYRNESKPFFYIMDKLPPIDLDQVFDFVMSTDTITKLQFEGTYYDYIPSKTLLVKFDPGKLSSGYKRNVKDLSAYDSVCKIDLNMDYLFLNQFFVLDLFSTYQFTRPIYFGVTVSQENKSIFSGLFQCEGLTEKVTPYRFDNPIKEDNVGYINTAIQYEKLLKAAPVFVTDTAQKYYHVQNMLFQTYCYLYYRLADKLIDENKKDSALSVLDYFTKSFLANKTELLYGALGIIQDYYRLNHIDEAHNLAEKLLVSTVRSINNYDRKSYKNREEIEELKETLRQLSQYTNQYEEKSNLNQTVKQTCESMNERK